MRKVYISVCIMLAILAVAAALCGCRQSDLPARQYLDDVIKQHPSLPTGRFYGVENLSEALAFSLYGDEGTLDGTELGGGTESLPFPEEFGLCDDYCVWLCSNVEAPCEFAVFHARARSDTEAVAKMILRRLEKLKVFWRETPYADDVDDGRVTIVGKYVVFELYSGS